MIWDFSGNVLEWIRDDITTLQTSGGNDYIQNDPYTDALAWGPTNSYSSQTGTDKAGLGYFNDGTINAVLRGGSWSSGDHSGLFFTDLSSGFLLGPDDISSYVGFRCVFVP